MYLSHLFWEGRMPTVLPVTELQRNTAALTDEAMRTKEPIYLTRRGKAAVVLDSMPPSTIGR